MAYVPSTQVDALLTALASAAVTEEKVQEMYFGTKTLLWFVYGEASDNLARLDNELAQITKDVNNLSIRQQRKMNAIKGTLTGIKTDLTAGY